MYLIKIKGAAYSSHHVLKDFDGLECTEDFAKGFTEDFMKQYFGEAVLSDGFMKLEFDVLNQELYMAVTYKSTLELDLAQLNKLRDITYKELASGIGRKFSRDKLITIDGVNYNTSFYHSSVTNPITQWLAEQPVEVNKVSYARKVVRAIVKTITRERYFTAGEVYRLSGPGSEEIEILVNEDGTQVLNLYSYREENDEEFLNRVVKEEIENGKRNKEEADIPSA